MSEFEMEDMPSGEAAPSGRVNSTDESSDDDDLSYSGRCKRFFGSGDDDERGLRKRDRFRQWLNITWREIKSHKLNFCLGFSACLLVVLVVVVVMSTLDKAPVIFLRLAETGGGEIDLEVRSNPSVKHGRTLNYTLVSQLLAASPTPESFQRHSPRFFVGARVYGGCPEDRQALYDTERRCFGGTCHSRFCRSVGISIVRGIDTLREREMGLGRNYEYDPLPPGSCRIQKELASALGVGEGDYIDLRLEYFSAPLFSFAYAAHVEEDEDFVKHSGVAVRYKIESVLPTALGKFSTEDTEVILVEYEHFVAHLADQADPRMPDDVRARLRAVDPYEYAHTIGFNLPSPRIEYYLSSDYDEIKERVVKWASSLLYVIGFVQLDYRMPVLKELDETQIFSLFLGLILNVIITILTGLCVVLIYSLLMINVETRTFELGVLRMVGTTRSNVVELMLVHAFSYSLPAWILGLVVGQVVFAGIADYFGSVTLVNVPPGLSLDAVLLATALGVLIPVLASIFPIRSALGRSLLDSLDTTRSKTKAVEISLSRSEDNAISWVSVLLGTVMVLFGFAIYYLFPLALLAFNLTLLLNMFFALILCMLLGLTLLSLNFEHLLERAVVVLFFSWWEKAGVTAIVVKNLVAHRVRNRKTTLLYSVSIAVILFLQVTYNLQIMSFLYTVQLRQGAYMSADDETVRHDKLPPGEKLMGLDVAAFESALLGLGDLVVAWSFSTHRTSADAVEATQMKNVGLAYDRGVQVKGIMPNFFNVSISRFLQPSLSYEATFAGGEHAGAPLDIAEQLYTVDGSHSAAMGTSYQADLGVETLATPAVLVSTVKAQPFPRIFRNRLLPLAFLDAAPTFRFSRFLSGTRDAVVSIPAYIRLSMGKYDSVDDVPFENLIVKMKDGISDGEIDKVYSALENVASEDTLEATDVDDYRTIVEEIDVAGQSIDLFFTFTTVMAMVVSYFSLVASMYTNIHQQTKEISVLRALGVTRRKMWRIYVEEAFVLVLAAGLLGVFIGSVVGYTMTLQRVLFTQLPIPFIFPYNTLITVFIVSLLSALGSAFIPIRSLVAKPIVQVMRMN